MSRASSRSFRRNLADFPDDPNIIDRILYNDIRYADSSPGGAIDVDIEPMLAEYIGDALGITRREHTGGSA